MFEPKNFSSVQVHDGVDVEENPDDVVVLRKNSTLVSTQACTVTYRPSTPTPTECDGTI